MQDETLDGLVSGPHLLGRSERGARANSGGDKRSTAEARNSSGPPLDNGCEGECYFGVGGKNFLGEPKNNQLLNTTAPPVIRLRRRQYD